MSPAGVVCCQVEISVIGCSGVQWNRTECGVCEGDHAALIMSRTWPPRSRCAMEEKWVP
jgi:hypothetical protein